jgi:hypothetical protein
MAANENAFVGTAGPRTSPAMSAAEKRLYEKRFFLTVGLAFAALILVGFSKNYYLRFLFDLPPLYSNLVRFHGVVMTAWVALFAAQTWLVSAKKVKLHMKLGWAGVVLAVLVLLTGYYVSIGALEHQTAADRGGIPPLVFLVVPIADLVLFTLFFGSAIVLRKKPAIHKRLMILTAANFLPPAAARFPVPALLAMGPVWIFGVPTVFTIAALAYDTWRNKKLNRVFLAGSVLLIASFPLRIMIGQTDLWLRFAGWLAS